MVELTRNDLFKELEDLKRIADLPALYLANFFIDLRNDVDKEVVSKQTILNDDKENKTKLNELWQQMIAKINSFEKQCIVSKLNLKSNKQAINLIEEMLNNNNEQSFNTFKEVKAETCQSRLLGFVI